MNGYIHEHQHTLKYYIFFLYYFNRNNGTVLRFNIVFDSKQCFFTVIIIIVLRKLHFEGKKKVYMLRDRNLTNGHFPNNKIKNKKSQLPTYSVS